MYLKATFECEICGETFNNSNDCSVHEDNCGVIKTFKCDKCGEEIKYTVNDNENTGLYFAQNECWNINLGRAGYGSKFDGSNINFNLCDDCLYELVESFKNEGKERVHYSGVNYSCGL
jgi:hypothetical protein